MPAPFFDSVRVVPVTVWVTLPSITASTTDTTGLGPQPIALVDTPPSVTWSPATVTSAFSVLQLSLATSLPP